MRAASRWFFMHGRKMVMGILALLFIGILAAGLWPEAEKPEPVYEGRKLSEWLGDLAPRMRNTATPYIEDRAEAALRAIGTNAWPFYLEWMGYEPNPLTRAKFYMASKSRDLI